MLLSHLSYPNRMRRERLRATMISPGMRDGTLAVLTVACVLAWACGGAGRPRETDAAARTRLVHRRGGRERPRFAHFNGMSGELLLPGDHGARRRRCSTTTTTATSTSIVVAGPDARRGQDARQAPFPPRCRAARAIGCSATTSSVRPGRHAHAALHRRHRRRAASTRDGYGMGVAAGDFDNDGCVDLYLHELRREPAASQQRRRHVHRRLEDRAAPTTPGWSVSAAFVDYDRDGWLDLFVGNYLHLQPRRRHRRASARPAQRDYCPPNSYQRAAEPPVSQQRGNGTFADVTAQALHRRRVRPGARRRRPPTSTATAGSTSTSPTTASRTSSGSTSTTARSRNTALLAGAALSARRARPKRAWASTPATSTTTATKICSSPN